MTIYAILFLASLVLLTVAIIAAMRAEQLKEAGGIWSDRHARALDAGWWTIVAGIFGFWGILGALVGGLGFLVETFIV